MTSPGNLRALLVWSLVGANLLVFALSAQSLSQSRQQYEERARAQTRNIAGVLARNISGSVEKIDLTLRTVTDELERQLAGKGLEEAAVDGFLLRQAGRLPEVRALRVTNADGLLILGRQGSGGGSLDLSNRGFFGYHRDHAGDSLHFSKPFIGSINKQYIVTLTRRYNRPDGRFAGVAIATIPVEHFAKLISQFDLGPDGSLILRDADLGLITRYPPIPDKPAGQIGNSQVSEIGRQLSKALESTVTYHAAAGSDGIERIYTLQRLQNAPMLIGVSVASADYLAQWRREAYRTGAMALGFLLLSLVSGGMLLRQHANARRQQQMLQQSEARLRAIADNASALIVMKDTQGRYLFANKLFKRLFHATDATLAGKTDYDLFPREAAQAFTENDRVVLRSGQPLEAEELVPQGDGLHTYISVKFPLTDSGGTIYAVCSIATDITGRRKAEEARAHLEAQLRASQKMEALGTLAGGVAHDFNNIVAAILGNVELASQDLEPGHAAAESLGEIRKASLRAKALVQQILSFGGRQATARKVISLEPVVAESERLLRATPPAGVRLNTICAADTPLVLADAAQIEQVLINLGTNAWQSVHGRARPGSIEVRLEARKCPAEPIVEAGFARISGEMPPGRCACLTVTDNGSGMAADTLIRIFEPFFTTKPVGRGTGLGLAVVHGIVQEHAGSIEVRSVPGEGSTFRICLPEAGALLAEVPDRLPELSPADGAGRHVLYVDDEEAIVFLMTRLLERRGYRVSGYTDPNAALAAVHSEPGAFDLAVTDYNMPDMSGLDVARSLKAIRPDLPIAIASGFLSDELREQAPAAGVSELIHKPNTVAELCEAVARLAQSRT